MVLESHNSNIGYSKVRVAFDGDQKQPIVKSSVMLTNLSSTTYTNNHYGPPSVTMRASSHDHNYFSRYSSTDMDPPPLSSSNTRFPSHSGQAATNNAMGSPAGSVNNEIPTQNSSVVGDVSEPFWIQQMKEGSMWNDPDELFLTEAKRFFTITDKRIFWEMGHALIELPEISNACKGMICNANDLVTILKKPEWKVIWTNEAADILPREMAAALVQAAYVYNPTERN